jgi:hypothetical protein
MTPRPRTRHSPTALALALLVALAGPAAAQDAAQDIDIDAHRVAGMPALQPGEIDRLRAHLGLAGDRSGHAAETGKLGDLTRQLAGEARGDLALARRSAKQMTLGVRVRDYGGATLTQPKGRWTGVLGDVAPIVVDGRPLPGVFKAGAVVQAWMTKDPDVNGPSGRPKDAWKFPSDIPAGWAMNRLPKVWKGLYAATASSPGAEDGMTRGHVVANADSTWGDDAEGTFEYYSNAFPQSAASNAGAYREMEKTFQTVASSPRYNAISYAGPLWKPFEYRRLDGSTARVEPELLQGKIPKPTAYWRFSLIFPERGPNGEAWDLADALPYARAVAEVVPNAQDDELFVADLERFITTGAEIERLSGVELMTHLEGDPQGEVLRRALLGHRDSGRGLPRETGAPEWKLAKLRQLAKKGGRSRAATEAQRRLDTLAAGRPTSSVRRLLDSGRRAAGRTAARMRAGRPTSSVRALLDSGRRAAGRAATRTRAGRRR